MSNIQDVKATGIKLIICGEVHTMKFTLNAFAELEESYGSVAAALEALNTGSLKAVRKLLWAGLLHENPEYTELEVGAMIDISELPELSKQLGKALGSSIPKPKKQAGKVAPKKVVEGKK